MIYLSIQKIKFLYLSSGAVYGKNINNFDYIIIHGGLCKVFVTNTFKKIAEWENLNFNELEKKFIQGAIHGERIVHYTRRRYFFHFIPY